MARVLAIGAHFDDVELGCGGTLLEHNRAGDEVSIFVVTDSAYEHWSGTMERSASVALTEGQAAAEVLGARLISGGLETKELRYDRHLIELIEQVIVDCDADIVYTHWDSDVHQDHSAIGRATLNAARHVPSLLMYRSNWYQTTTPWRANHFVDISDHIHGKECAIRCHVTEVAKRGDKWINFFRNENANTGQRLHVDFAEEFVAVKYLAPSRVPAGPVAGVEVDHGRVPSLAGPAS